MKTKVCIILVCLTMMASSAYATVINGVCGEHLTWTLNSEDSTLVISGRGDMSGMRFASQQFRDVIKYVVFPEGLTSISECAFGETWNTCKNLQSVNLPDSVVSIGKMAFRSCVGIKEVRCGKRLKSISDSAFVFCGSLEHLELNDSLESIGYGAFLQDTALRGTIVFPESLKRIGYYAFNTYSQKVRKLTAIWNAKHCQHDYTDKHGGSVLWRFSKVKFGEKVEYIPDYLCSSTYNDTIILPESVDSIGSYAFAWGNNLKHIEMPSSLRYIGKDAFYFCQQLSSLRVPEGVSVIPQAFCQDCQALTEVVLPSTTDSIMRSAFSGCTALQHITIPAGTKHIDEYVFFNCSALQGIDLPEGLKSIGQKAFINCTSLESVTIPEGMTTISESVFANCSALREVNIPNSVRTIEARAFQDCSLDTLVLPSELNLIGSGAFLSQKKITEVVIPDEVRQIKSNAFEGCSGLKKVVFGKKTAMIDAEAFKNDSMLIEIRSRAAYPPLVESATFAGVPDSAWLFVPVQSIAAYAEDPVWGRFRMPKEEEINYVTVDAEETTANFTWPTDSTASSYQIDIYKDGPKFCSLTLDSRGRLLGISFAPGRNASMDNADSGLPYSLSFMVTGLDVASRYNYVLSALDKTGKPIHVYFGDFATRGFIGDLLWDGYEVIPTPPVIPRNPEGKPTGIEETGSEEAEKKAIIEGRLLFITPQGIYDITGKRIE